MKKIKPALVPAAVGFYINGKLTSKHPMAIYHLKNNIHVMVEIAVDGGTWVPDVTDRLKPVYNYIDTLTDFTGKAKDVNDEKINIGSDTHRDIVLKADIHYICADSNYCKVFFAKGIKKLSNHPLDKLFSHLPDADFFWPHRSHIISRKHILKVIDGRSLCVIMIDGTRLSIPETIKAAFLAWYK